MRLSGLLKPRHIIANLQSVDRWHAIEELLDLLIKRGSIPVEIRTEVLASLREREDLLSTGIGEGVAIPHAFSSHLEDVVAAFGRSIPGIDFLAQDGEPTHFIVLFISPRGVYQKHLLALAAIARHFTKQETRRKLLNATDAEELYSTLRVKNLEL